MGRAIVVIMTVMVAAVLGAAPSGAVPLPADSPVARGPAAGSNVVVNGDFETGTFSGWTTGGPATSIVTTAHGGTFAAQLGSSSPTKGNSTMQQTVTVPPGATLSVWYRPRCPGTVQHDRAQVQVRNTSGTTLLTVLKACSNSNTWTLLTRSLTKFAGQTVVLWFSNHDDNAANTANSTLFDDISLSAAADDFSLAATPPSMTVSPASSATTTVTTSVITGATQSLTLSASGLPSGATASFDPPTVNAGATSTLTITPSVSTPVGSSTVTVMATGSSATHTTTVALHVTQPPAGLVQLGADPYTASASEHATEVEPDTFAQGSTVVSVFQTGRFNNGGSNDLGWATSTDNGQTWTTGFLPGITTAQGGGRWARASDPVVAYDAKAGQWLIAGLVVDSSGTGRGVSVSRSPDGKSWSNPVIAVSSTSSFLDKDWIVCDATSTSPHYGNCYVEFDNNSTGNTIFLLSSTDGGLSWSAPRQPADSPLGLGGQPLVRPDGTVVVPYLADTAGQIRSFVSSDGGATWGASVLVSSASTHTVAAGMRTTPLPSAEIDAAGTVYLSWQDCRFRTGCGANDIVFATSSNGTTWGAVRRVPIDATSSTVDHFIPGLAVDHATSGATTHLGLYYYFFPNTACTASTCQLEVGFISSTDGGSTWGTASQVAGPSTVSQIAATTEGAMVGDYLSASFVNARAVGAFAFGLAPSGSAYNEAMYTVAGGLATHAGTTPSTAWQGPALIAGPSTPTPQRTAS